MNWFKANRYKVYVLVLWGCYDKNAIDWVPLKQLSSICHNLEAGKSKVKAPADLVSRKGWLSGSSTVPPHCALARQQAADRSRGPLRTLLPSWRLHCHDLLTTQKPCLLIPSPWGLGCRHKDPWGHKHSDHGSTCDKNCDAFTPGVVLFPHGLLPAPRFID